MLCLTKFLLQKTSPAEDRKVLYKQFTGGQPGSYSRLLNNKICHHYLFLFTSSYVLTLSAF